MKARIYAQNRDVLDQLEDPGEKVEKLEDAVNSQEQEYLERLDGIERRRLWAEGEMSSMGSKNEDATAAHSGKWERSTNTKRKRVVVEEDDGDEDWEDEDEGGSVGSKRPKV
jgi:histone acetyltransferase 1